MGFALLDHTEEKTTINELLTGTFREKDRQINFAIEELEKIKAEVCEPNEMEYFENSNVWQKWFCNLIDKHISELKGETE